MIKKISILVLAILFTAGAGYAQEKSKTAKPKKNLPSPLFEVWGGMGMSTAMGTVSATDYRLAGLFGAGFSLPISQQNNIHMELAYTFQGFQYGSDSLTHKDITYKAESQEQRFNYFKVIVMDKYFIDKKKVLYVNGGIYGAYLSQARFQATYYADPTDEYGDLSEVDNENKDSFNPYDFGLEGGFGVRLGNKQTSNFTIEARASYGIINAAKQDIGTGNNFYGVLKLGFDIPL
jgi:hypothetical protein